MLFRVITGTEKIADYAALSRTPIALHNVGSLLMTFATHSLPSLCRTSSSVKVPSPIPAAMWKRWPRPNPPQVSKGEMALPKGVGLAVDLNPTF